MISVETEDKVRKFLALVVLFTMPLFAFVIKDNDLKLKLSIPLLIIMTLLMVRKFFRDKKEEKPLQRYYIAFGFILLALIMCLIPMVTL